MTERTRRATEAVDAHYTFIDSCRPGSVKDQIEGPLLDVARDPRDPRYGHEKFLYGGKSFQAWLADMANQARTFTATTDLWREVTLTIDMLMEEGIDWLPLQPHHVPTPRGFILFPWGVEDPTHIDGGVTTTQDKDAFGRVRDRWIEDSGGGARYFVDGFMWEVNDRVARDGHAGAPTHGVTILPLTRWRDEPTDRPFRMYADRHPDADPRMPRLVCSDVTAWAFDEEGQIEWSDPSTIMGADDETFEALGEKRRWMRGLVWSTFRWLSEEVWTSEDPDSRPIARKMQRARPVHTNPPAEDGMVVIVDLRLERKAAIAAGDTGGEPPWWRTRWIVRGHWAKRRTAIRHPQTDEPIGPVTGPDAVEGVTFAYKRVWIEPYEKGPDTAPLVLRDRVGVLSR